MQLIERNHLQWRLPHPREQVEAWQEGFPHAALWGHDAPHTQRMADVNASCSICSFLSVTQAQNMYSLVLQPFYSNAVLSHSCWAFLMLTCISTVA